MQRVGRESYDIRGRVIRETDKAVLLTQRSATHGATGWIPRSRIRATYELAGGEVVLTVPCSVAARKGFV